MGENKEKDSQKIFASSKTLETRAGEVTMHELRLQDINVIFEDLGEVFKHLPESTEETPTVQVITKLLSQENTLKAVKNILANVTGKQKEFFGDLPLVETLRLVKTFFEVNDVGQIQQLFFEMTEMLPAQNESQKG